MFFCGLASLKTFFVTLLDFVFSSVRVLEHVNIFVSFWEVALSAFPTMRLQNAYLLRNVELYVN